MVTSALQSVLSSADLAGSGEEGLVMVPSIPGRPL